MTVDEFFAEHHDEGGHDVDPLYDDEKQVVGYRCNDCNVQVRGDDGEPST